MITEKTVKISKHLCGFCSTGGCHDLCPGGVLNGNQVEVVVCPCTCGTPKLRCLDCNAREDVNPATWTCNDVEACAQKRAARRSEFEKTTAGTLTGDGAPKARAKAAKLSETPPKAARTGSCLCCGEPTKGGLFLPGHDARYLARTVTEVKAGASLDDTMTAWHRAGISEALQAKLVKRLGAA